MKTNPDLHNNVLSYSQYSYARGRSYNMSIRPVLIDIKLDFITNLPREFPAKLNWNRLFDVLQHKGKARGKTIYNFMQESSSNSE